MVCESLRQLLEVNILYMYVYIDKTRVFEATAKLINTSLIKVSQEQPSKCEMSNCGEYQFDTKSRALTWSTNAHWSTV